ncbi:EbhA [Streptococcus pluranimalium]|uniref:EbhA n=1 Tax=Streptococcus pluranimalium TaxID=82348 RepID=UPI0039FCD2B6
MKKKTIGVSIATLAILIGLGYYFFLYSPHEKAVNRFEVAASQVKKKNDDLNTTISKAETLLKKKEEPLDKETLNKLKASITEAKKKRRQIPKIKDKTEDINKQTKALSKKIDYSAEKKAIEDNTKIYQMSVTQLKQITNPSQAFIEDRLKEIDTIQEVQSVTETNDPNGQLNKQGGYTASVYFSDEQVTESVFGNDLVDKGTEAGGNIEVYKTKDEAEKRNVYLSAFDGGQGFLDPGSHYVYGTVIIRTSRHLTASQQNALTKKIYEKLIEIKDSNATNQPQKKTESTSSSSNKSQPSTATEQGQQSNTKTVQPSQSTNKPTESSTPESSSDDEIAYGGRGGAWGTYDDGYESGYLSGYEDGTNSVPYEETPEDVWTYEDSIGYKMSNGEYSEPSASSQP